MVDTFAGLLIGFLSVYGMVSLIGRLNQWLFAKNIGLLQPSVSWVILAKDNEQEIEYILRQVMSRLRDTSNFKDLTVIDLDSKDATYDIALRLSKYNQDFTVMQESLRVDLLKDYCQGELICLMDTDLAGSKVVLRKVTNFS